MDDRVRALVERALEAAGPDDDAAFREWIDAFLAGSAGTKETGSAWLRALGFEAGVRAACGGDVLAARARARVAVVRAALTRPTELDAAIAEASSALDAIEQASGGAE